MVHNDFGSVDHSVPVVQPTVTKLAVFGGGKRPIGIKDRPCAIKLPGGRARLLGAKKGARDGWGL